MDWLLPLPADNVFRGRRFVMWVYALLVATTIARSLIHAFSADGGAQSIASIPLSSYSTPAANAVIFIFSLWGMSQLLMGVFQLVVLVRYRALIPLMLVFMLAEYLLRILVGELKTIETLATPHGAIANYAIPAVLLVLIWFSRPSRQADGGGAKAR